MPTAARLFAALSLAGVAWFASVLYIGLLPEGTPAGWLPIVNAGLGLITGWRVVGRLVSGKSYVGAIGHGVRGAFTVYFFAVLFWSIWRMLELSLKKRYDDPSEAINAVFALISDYSLLLLEDPTPGLVLLFGGIGSALLAEWAKRRFL
jgi:hypothetical protein